MAFRERPNDMFGSKEVAFASESLLDMTAAELDELQKKVMDLIAPYQKGQRGDIPDGTRTVSASFRAFPLPDRDVKD